MVTVGGTLSVSSLVIVPIPVPSPRLSPVPPDGVGFDSVSVKVSFASTDVSPQIVTGMVRSILFTVRDRQGPRRVNYSRQACNLLLRSLGWSRWEQS